MERRGEKGRGLRELKDVYTARVLHDWLSKNAGERKRAKALSRFGRARRRVRRGEAIFASGNPVFLRGSRFLVIFDCAVKRRELLCHADRACFAWTDAAFIGSGDACRDRQKALQGKNYRPAQALGWIMEIKMCLHIHRPPKFYDTDKDMQLKLNVSAQAGTADKTKQCPDGKSRLRRTAVFQVANCRRAKAEDLAKHRKWMILTAKRLRQNETKCRR